MLQGFKNWWHNWWFTTPLGAEGLLGKGAEVFPRATAEAEAAATAAEKATQAAKATEQAAAGAKAEQGAKSLAAVVTQRYAATEKALAKAAGPIQPLTQEQTAAISKAVSTVIQKYPADAFKCDSAASAIGARLKALNMPYKIVRLEDAGRAGFMRSANGSDVAKSGYHEVVVSAGKFYDTLTGPGGATAEEYLRLWNNDTAPFLKVVSERAK